MEPTEWWQKPFVWLFARRPDWRDAVGGALLGVGNRFYLLLAIVFALIGAWDQFVAPLNQQLSDASFDWLMRHRPIPYKTDPGIVVIDIDEASLAALAPEYGRWPWPREVLAQVAARVEEAGARAVVFDILFADPDVANPDGDRAFDRYVAASRNSFYTATRLNPKNDAVSQITVSMLNFAAPDPDVPAAKVDPKRTIALLPPYFKSIYDTTRTGVNNVGIDQDNEVRWYPNYETLGGYRIPSLPYRLAQWQGWPPPTAPRSLINWPRGTAPYRTISFADGYRAARAQDGAFFGQFAKAVVLIGSTAPGLNDINATPVDHTHPGIYTLATVIDNTKNGRFLWQLRPLWLWVAELIMLAAAARLFSRTDRATSIAKYFVIIPVGLLLISLFFVSVSDLLMDLSVPAAVLFGYFSIATMFETSSRGFLTGTGSFAPTPRELAGAQLQVACLPASLGRSAVQAMLMGSPYPIKLWIPPRVGLGKHWNGQGWVLWRWFVPGPRGAAASEPDLKWHDVPTADRGLAFSLAHTITAAAMTGLAHQTPQTEHP
jgi:adenylate cyclase